VDKITIDFESKGIRPRPLYPPDPVGVAIKYSGRPAKYYSWGHWAGGNNCTLDAAKAALQEAWDSKLPLLFHNGKFDVAVATEKLGLTMPEWHRIHDTMFLLFLMDPYSPNLALKPSAARYLSMPPDEQEEVRDWLVTHQAEFPLDLVGVTEEGKRRKITEKNFGEFIWLAPGKLVGKYAIGDVDRTEGLFDLLMPEIKTYGMEEAYDVERELMPILLENEQQGMRTPLEKLEKDTSIFQDAVEHVEMWMRKRLHTPGINFNSPMQLAEALERTGIVTEFERTKKGSVKTSKDALTIDKFHDIEFYRAFAYRNKLTKAISTFMLPWLTTALATGGIIHTDWRQLKREGAGAITGRLSSSPNFQNIPKPWEEKDNAYAHPDFIDGLPELPHLRDYILPDIGQVFGHRDFSQQELRILAYFEDGPLKEAYVKNPRLDVHLLVKNLLEDYGLIYERGAVKGTECGILYGMGVTGISKRLGIPREQAGELIKAWHAVMPGVSGLISDLRQVVQAGDYIYTWGGRRYGMPPPMFIDGEWKSREYVLLNYLIQGSGADATKRAMIAYHKRTEEARILCNVHDEINVSCPNKIKVIRNEMRILSDCISSLDFGDVRMLSDSKIGPCWGSLKSFRYGVVA